MIANATSRIRQMAPSSAVGQHGSLRERREGFSIVELLVVLGIIGVLVSLLLPAVQMAREASRMAVCSNNIKQQALGLIAYEGARKIFPPGEVHGLASVPGYSSSDPNNASANHCDWEGQMGIWMNLIFPYTERQSDYDEIDFAIRPQYASEKNQAVLKRRFSEWLCPSNTYSGLTTMDARGDEPNQAIIAHYFAVNGSNELSMTPHSDGSLSYCHCNAHDGMFFNDSKVLVKDITDGLSKTAMIGEVWGRRYANHTAPAGAISQWGNDAVNGIERSRGMNLHMAVYFDVTPNAIRLTWKSGSFHPGGAQVGLADGSVRFVSDSVASDVFTAMATIKGGEIVRE